MVRFVFLATVLGFLFTLLQESLRLESVCEWKTRARIVRAVQVNSVSSNSGLSLTNAQYTNTSVRRDCLQLPPLDIAWSPWSDEDKYGSSFCHIPAPAALHECMWNPHVVPKVHRGD